MKFNTKNAHDHDIKILYDNTEIRNSSYIKFLGVNITNSLSWKNHIDSLIPKLSSTCYAIRAIKPFVNQKALLMVYYAYFHSIICYGIIFWGNSSYAINVFYLQKWMIWIITGIGNRTSCKQSFIALKIPTLLSLYIYSLLCFVVDNMDQYYFVSDIHNRNTRQVLNLNLLSTPNPLISIWKMLILYGHQTIQLSTIKFEKKLYKDVKWFKLKLKAFLSHHSFYTLEEYIEYSSWKDWLYTGCFYVL
jgi:hypothetical protein